MFNVKIRQSTLVKNISAEHLNLVENTKHFKDVVVDTTIYLTLLSKITGVITHIDNYVNELSTSKHSRTLDSLQMKVLESTTYVVRDILKSKIALVTSINPSHSRASLIPFNRRLGFIDITTIQIQTIKDFKSKHIFYVDSLAAEMSNPKRKMVMIGLLLDFCDKIYELSGSLDLQQIVLWDDTVKRYTTFVLDQEEANTLDSEVLTSMTKSLYSDVENLFLGRNKVSIGDLAIKYKSLYKVM